jgi:hypothetical protein
MRLLPDVSAGHAAVVVVVLFAPFAWHCVRTQRRHGMPVVSSQSLQVMAAAALCSFMAGYHVHEKSILISVMLLLPVACAYPAWRDLFAAFRYRFFQQVEPYPHVALSKPVFRFSCIAVSSLLPLLHTMRMAGILILIAHLALTMKLLSVSSPTRYITALYLIFIELAVLAVELRAPHLPFAPLAVRSIACACANVMALMRLMRLLHLSLPSRENQPASIAASANLRSSTAAAGAVRQ